MWDCGGSYSDAHEGEGNSSGNIDDNQGSGGSSSFYISNNNTDIQNNLDAQKAAQQSRDIINAQQKVGNGFDYSQVPSEDSGGVGNVKSVFNNVWATVRIVIQIASVAGVIFAGVMYMYSSADHKADIKKSLIYLVIGCVLVFSATTVISIVSTSFNQLTN